MSTYNVCYNQYKSFRKFYCMQGVYTGDATTQDQDTFLVERHCLTDLLDGLKSVCCCGMASNPWRLHSFVQVRDIINIILLVIQILIYNSVFERPRCFKCRRCQVQRRTWSSSRFFGGHYLLNQKYDISYDVNSELLYLIFLLFYY